MHSIDRPSTRVVLFQVKTPQEKLLTLAKTAALHFEKKEKLWILTEDEKTQVFVDELLWKLPASSFLPHCASDEPSSELISISKIKNNINQAHYTFNLCPTPLLIEGPFKIIYDFEDLSSPSRQNLSSIRFDAYKQRRFLIESRSV